MILAASLLEIYLFNCALKLMETIIWVVVCKSVFRAQSNSLCQWRLLKYHWNTLEIWSNNESWKSWKYKQLWRLGPGPSCSNKTIRHSYQYLHFQQFHQYQCLIIQASWFIMQEVYWKRLTNGTITKT